MSVSYTHLDVYKRQILKWNRPVGILIVINWELLCGRICLAVIVIDVYKRQQQYANLFLEPKSMQLTLGKDKYDQQSLHATGSALQALSLIHI